MNQASLSYRVLDALSVHGDDYALGLTERLKLGFFQRLRLYGAVTWLEDERLIESYNGPSLPARGNRPRRYYRLTEFGRRVVATMAAAPS